MINSGVIYIFANTYSHETESMYISMLVSNDGLGKVIIKRSCFVACLINESIVNSL